MTTAAMTPYRSQVIAGRENFWHLVHAEWTKFRTVRGWVIAMIVAIAATAAVPVLGQDHCGSACPAYPTGPGGEAVRDAFYFVHQPLTGNGAITVQMTSLTGLYSPSGPPSGPATRGQGGSGQPQMMPGLQPWSKAGIIIKENTSQGSAYAAMMVTGAHSVRMQWDYVNDTPGMAGSVSASSPRWLRLVRAGDTVTGYDSADGRRWTLVGTATLQGLTSTVQAGLFAASPQDMTQGSAGIGVGTASLGPTLATGVFHHVELSWPATGWAGTDMGGFGRNGVQLSGTFRQSAGALTVTGSGDIAPETGNLSLWDALSGSFAGLIALIVVGAMFITAEYRRGLIRVSLTASPRRGRLLAAKAVVAGAASFVTGLIAATAAIAVGEQTGAGTPPAPIPGLTLARMVAGTAALLAVAAVLALAIGTILAPPRLQVVLTGSRPQPPGRAMAGPAVYGSLTGPCRAAGRGRRPAAAR